MIGIVIGAVIGVGVLIFLGKGNTEAVETVENKEEQN